MLLICKLIYVLLSLFLTSKVVSITEKHDKLPALFLTVIGLSGFYALIFTILL